MLKPTDPKQTREQFLRIQFYKVAKTEAGREVFKELYAHSQFKQVSFDISHEELIQFEARRASWAYIRRYLTPELRNEIEKE